MVLNFKIMKVRSRNLSKEDKIKFLDALYTATSTLKTRDDMKRFLRDLLTESERIMIGRRIVIAHKLLNNEPYDQIVETMKAGKDTIAKIDRWLQDETRGYEKAIKEFEKILESRKKYAHRDNYKSGPFAQIKKKYPLHFFLFNLFDK